MLALLAGPALLAVTPATVTLAVTCGGKKRDVGRAGESKTKGGRCKERAVSKRAVS